MYYNSYLIYLLILLKMLFDYNIVMTVVAFLFRNDKKKKRFFRKRLFHDQTAYVLRIGRYLFTILLQYYNAIKLI